MKSVIKKRKILINCSNLHNSGGVAVAVSFVDCLSHEEYQDLDIYVWVSSEVNDNLNALGTDKSVFASCCEINYYGIKAIWQGIGGRFSGFDVVFTVFGPAYYLSTKTVHIMGFAQPNIIYPSNHVLMNLALLEKIKLSMKFKIQELFFARANSLVVELEHVEVGLNKKFLFRNKTIDIVYSSVDSVFLEPGRWGELTVPSATNSIRLGVISKNAPNKNLKVLPAVKEVLWENHKIQVEFYVTFPENEWNTCSEYFKNNVVNVGPLRLNQCPAFYSSMDGVIFPSLLECFSAVPIEAMIMKKPLFISDMPFFRDVCRDWGNYFDPYDVADISNSVADYFSQPKDKRNAGLHDASCFAMKYANPSERARKYMDIIFGQLSK
jgi:glycosyltransferase involved in cell wall biosynthesis